MIMFKRVSKFIRERRERKLREKLFFHSSAIGFRFKRIDLQDMVEYILYKRL